ncbi:hypothetical protein LCGC14_3158800 [marine sediment metagenome]|uniref:Uncharacterized protein n=1 Tax=marine sediment metagenome TaxID=412755 RepID=A0A0F8WFX2_9ZZZZ
MSGNTRGKLKEHFEGIHKNLDWCLHHTAKAATLIEVQLALLPDFHTVKGDAEKEQQFFRQHPMYQAVTSLGEGIAVFDALTKDIYDKI